MTGRRRRLRLAVVGAGLAASPHLRALAELKVDVRWIVTRDPARAAAALAVLPGACLAAMIDEALSDPGVDVVLLLTPPNTRLDIIAACARAGKAVIAEKPLDITPERARCAVEICSKAGVPLAVVHQHRFREVVPHLKKMLDASELGPLHAIEVRVPWWRPQSYYDEPGRGTFARDGGGAMITQAIHVLDLALHLFGSASVVCARTATTACHRMEAEDLATALVEWECGAVGTMMASTAHRPGFSDAILVTGRDGTALLEGEQLKVWDRHGRLSETGKPPPMAPPAHPMDFPHDGHRRLLDATLSAIADRKSVPVDGRDAVRVLDFIAEIEIASARHCADRGSWRGGNV